MKPPTRYGDAYDYLRFFLSGAWVRAEAATERTVLLFDFLSNLLAFEATLFEVLSFLPISSHP